VCRKSGFFICLASLLVLVNISLAGTYTWTNGSPYGCLWNDPRNWDPNTGVPGESDDAVINPPPERGPAVLLGMAIGNIRGPRWDSDSNQVMDVVSGTVMVNGSWEFGDNGNGTSIINIFGGPDITVNGEIWHREGNAELSISDSANLIVNYQVRLADSGSAILDISGEPNIVIAGDLRAGDSSGSWFEAYISGGSVSVGGDFVIGSDGSGVIDVSGTADIYVEEAMWVCDGNGTATMNMSGGDVNTGEMLLRCRICSVY